MIVRTTHVAISKFSHGGIELWRRQKEAPVTILRVEHQKERVKIVYASTK